MNSPVVQFLGVLVLGWILAHAGGWLDAGKAWLRAKTEASALPASVKTLAETLEDDATDAAKAALIAAAPAISKGGLNADTLTKAASEGAAALSGSFSEAKKSELEAELGLAAGELANLIARKVSSAVHDEAPRVLGTLVDGRKIVSLVTTATPAA